MSHRIQRRDFLILGSTSVAYSMTLGSSSLVAGDESAVASPVSVGYWSKRERAEDHNSEAGPDAIPFHADVVAAARLRTGDREFLRTAARVTIHGVVEAEKAWSQPELDALSVFACFRLPGGEPHETIRHHVWDLGKTPVVNRGAPVSFTIPIDEETGLRLAVQRYDGMQSTAARYVTSRLGVAQPSRASARTSSQDVVLSVHPESGSHGLRRGVYFIAGLAHGSATPPSWSDLQFRISGEDSDVRCRRLARRGLSGPKPVDFDYLVMSVDHSA